MKIKYRKSDSVIIAMGEVDFLGDDDHDVEEVNIDIPNGTITDYKRIPGGIEKRPQIDLDSEINLVKTSRRNAKREVLNSMATLTGLTKSKIIKGLKMALEDGDDD